MDEYEDIEAAVALERILGHAHDQKSCIHSGRHNKFSRQRVREGLDHQGMHEETRE